MTASADATVPREWPPLARDSMVLVLFIAIAAVYMHPLFEHIRTRLALNAGDPALNAAVLWWNATVTPLTSAWWNQPWFDPATGVTALTENLIGLWPIATPIYWLSHSAVVAYNLTFFLTWPLSAFAAYVLVRRITARTDAGLVAGLAFGFSPYRVSAEIGHLQSLSAFWLPIGLAALHAYFGDNRRRWLAVFGGAWVLQSLANGYYMLFGGVLIALWLLYFGTAAGRRSAALRALGVWFLSSVLLLPIILGYRNVHEYYGLTRTLLEAQAFSAHPDSWFQVPDVIRWWHGVLPSGKDTLFPGVTVVLLVGAGLVLGMTGIKRLVPSVRYRTALQLALTVAIVGCAIAVAIWIARGPWAVQFGWVVVRMSNPGRALALLAACSVALLWMVPVREVFAARKPFLFYTVATALMAVLACGPVLSLRDQVILASSPYRWLMALPGFTELRVPSRFWMMGVLCLAVAAGLAFAAIVPVRRGVRYITCAVVCAGILADGWLTAMPTAPAPPMWTDMRGADRSLPLLELPLGPDWDNAATLRVTAHGRRVMNGVSGYDPPHYGPLRMGLAARDPEMLEAIASLGPYEIAVESANDRDGRWKEYVQATATGAVQVAADDERTVFRVPGVVRPAPALGAPLPIVAVRTHLGDAPLVFDHRADTGWISSQQGGEWLIADLGRDQAVAGISLAINQYPDDYPVRLAIDTSTDGAAFAQVWAGGTAGATFLAVLQSPRAGSLRVPIPSQVVRFVRVRQTAVAASLWRVTELEIHAPVVRQP